MPSSPKGQEFGPPEGVEREVLFLCWLDLADWNEKNRAPWPVWKDHAEPGHRCEACGKPAEWKVQYAKS